MSFVETETNGQIFTIKLNRPERLNALTYNIVQKMNDFLDQKQNYLTLIEDLIVYENQVIARGHNQSKRLNDSTAHAEMIAITSAQNTIGSRYLNDCELYVTL